MNTALTPEALPVIFYRRPHGRATIVDVRDVDPETCSFFVQGKYHVSMEELNNGDIVAYARPPWVDEEDEVLVIGNINTTSCQNLFKSLASECRKSWC